MEREHQAAQERSSKPGFFDIFTAERARLKRIIAGMGLGASDAEDILQDVSVKTFKQAPKYETEEDAKRWLMKVTVNHCLTEHRRRRHFRRRAEEILKRRTQAETKPTKPDDKAIAAEELEIVRETLQQLDDSLLTVMALRYFSELNSTEVGDILGLTPSTVRSRLRQGRMILARRLIERGIEP
jgi:RNA polymerase sigma-70 factor (ECF subfamily)